MKKVAVFVLLAFLLSMAAMASEKSVTMKGWVSDAMCGAKGAKASHKDCAKKCADAGEALVFVTDKDQQVLKVANQEALKSHAGEHVEVAGSLDNSGALKVDKVTTIAENTKPAGGEHKH